MKVSREEYDRIQAELDEPPRIIPELAERLQKSRDTRCPHGTVETSTAKCRDCNKERAR